MDASKISNQIVSWLKDQLQQSNQKGFVIGVSGGIDSAVVSTLCTMTGLPTIVVNIPIYHTSTKLANKHMCWLVEKYSNVSSFDLDLSTVCDRFERDLHDTIFKYNLHGDEARTDLVYANLQSRLRMCALYAFANASQFLVVGTGNKIEDYGIGFCTKGGDNLVDLSPIGDLLKSEVRALAAYLEINEDIQKAAPTDGLWADGRSDEDQIGATYDELELAMSEYNRIFGFKGDSFEEKLETAHNFFSGHGEGYTERQKEVLCIYHARHTANAHKMKMPPICIIERYKNRR